jgi:hypothetical protein
MSKINYPAVVVAAVLYWMLGALWYSPLLFAQRFIALKGYTPEDIARIQSEGTAKLVAAALLGSLIASYVLAHFVRFVQARGVADGLKTGFWVCLGFIFTSNLETVLFEQRPLGLYLINNGYHLAGFLLMGAILASWRRQGARELAYQS